MQQKKEKAEDTKLVDYIVNTQNLHHHWMSDFAA